MSTEQLERDLRTFVQEGSGLAAGLVIRGNAKGPRPKDPYASLLYVDDERQGYPVYVQGTTQVTAVQFYRTRFSLQFYRDGAVALAFRWRTWAESEVGVARAAALGFQSVFPLAVRRLDSIIADLFEERALIEWRVEWVYDSSQDTPVVDRLELDLVSQRAEGVTVTRRLEHGD